MEYRDPIKKSATTQGNVGGWRFHFRYMLKEDNNKQLLVKGKK
jgi:hypothetical protein